MMNLPDICAKRASLTPHATALHDLVSGTSLTYKELDQRAGRTAGMLHDRGVESGDRVAILCRNRIEFFELLFACGKIGAILVPFNWRMPAIEMRVLLDDSKPVLLVLGNEDRETAKALCLQSPVIELDGTGSAGYDALCSASEPYRARDSWPFDECWYLIYTSGTTGRPKAVIQTYGMALANYVNIRHAMQIGADDVTLNYLPLFHTAGINLVTLPTLIEGGEVLMMPDVDMSRIVDLIAAGRLDTFFAVPAVYQQLSAHPKFESLDLTRVRSWGCGGAPLPDALVARYLSRGARVCNGMGMTETGPTALIMDSENVSAKVGSVGKPQPLSAVRIVDEQGRDVAQGDVGELWFSGPGVSPGYWQREDANNTAFSEDGWLKSGDMGRRDEDGYYFVVGRIKDMFISGGENVYPAEVENVLATHPDVLEAAVVSRPDQKWGEVGQAYILTKPEHSLPGDNAMIAFCRARLAAYKVPKTFTVVTDFPRTAAGKVQKHLVKENG